MSGDIYMVESQVTVIEFQVAENVTCHHGGRAEQRLQIEAQRVIRIGQHAALHYGRGFQITVDRVMTLLQLPVGMHQGMVAFREHLLEVQHPLRRLDACVQFVSIERLGQEIVCTCLHACKQVIVRVAAGQQDEVDIMGDSRRAYRAAQFNTAHVWHHPVTDNQLDRLFFQ